jgi:hypothetical protein
MTSRRWSLQGLELVGLLEFWLLQEWAKMAVKAKLFYFAS